MKRKRYRFIRNQSGLTLVEMLVAISIGAVILFGAVIYLYHMTTAADDNEAKSFASLQVQYVGFWINEDAAQARMISLGDTNCSSNGFPLVISWGNSSYSEKITYDLSPVAGQAGRANLYRTREVDDGGPIIEETHLVAEHIDSDATGCYRKDYGDNPAEGVSFALKSLWVDVAADIDGNRAESSYEIFPRSRVEWWPQVEDPTNPEVGSYIGPPCTPGP